MSLVRYIPERPGPKQSGERSGPETARHTQTKPQQRKAATKGRDPQSLRKKVTMFAGRAVGERHAELPMRNPSNGERADAWV